MWEGEGWIVFLCKSPAQGFRELTDLTAGSVETRGVEDWIWGIQQDNMQLRDNGGLAQNSDSSDVKREGAERKWWSQELLGALGLRTQPGKRNELGDERREESRKQAVGQP